MAIVYMLIMMKNNNLIATRVDDTTRVDIDELARKHDVTRSIVMRWALKKFIEDEGLHERY